MNKHEVEIQLLNRKISGQQKMIERASELFIKLEDAYGNQSKTGKTIRQMICYLNSKQPWSY